MSLSSGTKLAHYEIVEPIGKGGMGEVYRARDTKLGRDVAIKVLPEEFARDKERLGRFEREAQLLAQLNHPNVATLHGLEEHDRQQFLVMELVRGRTLAERLSDGALAVEEAIPLFIQVADGLEAAHDKGIIHRDLKPANIKLTPDEKAKILDFGLAKAFRPAEEVPTEASQSPTKTRGTALGAIMGTASYMSPEQARGKSVDARTDLWAFGCCLYEALTGSKAFDGGTVTDILASVIKNEPDWDRLPEKIPSALRRVVRRCLAKDARDRLHHIADARIELQDGANDDARPPRVASRAFAGYLLGAAVMGGLVVWLLAGSTPRGPELPSHTAIALPRGTRLPVISARAPSIAISPDGRHVAFEARRDSGPRQLYWQALGRRDAQLVESSDGVRSPFFSPDGQWLGFYAGGKLRKISVGGGASVEITDATDDIRGASWGPRDEIVYAPGRESGLWRVSAFGGTPEELTTPDREAGEKAHRLPEFLPGGEAVLFVVGESDLMSFDDARIEVLVLATGERRVVIEGGMNPHYAATGHILYARRGEILAVPFDVDALEVTGAPVSVQAEIVTAPVYGTGEFTSSRNGSLLYARGAELDTRRRLIWVDRDGVVEPLPMDERAFNWGSLSPDDRSIALLINGAVDSIWTYDVFRGTLTPLAAGWDNMVPTWTPDGRRITFGSNRGGLPDIWWQVADGSTPAERLLSSEEEQMPHSWSPDGRTLAYYVQTVERGWDVGVMNRNDLEPTVFLGTGFNELSPRFSPDGRWIAYESDESGRYEVYVRSFPGAGSKQQVSTGGGVFPVWSRDGTEIFYLEGNKMMAVDVRLGDMRLGQPHRLFELEDVRPNFDVTSDGRFLMTIDSTQTITHLNLVQNWFPELERLVPPDD